MDQVEYLGLCGGLWITGSLMDHGEYNGTCFEYLSLGRTVLHRLA